MKGIQKSIETLFHNIKAFWNGIKPSVPGGRTWELTVADIAVAAAALCAVIWFCASVFAPDPRISVTIEADARTINCHVFPGGNVSALLSANDITVNEADELSCAATDTLEDGMTITVTRAVPVAVRSGNEVSVLHMTSGTVGDALREAGVSYDVDDELSHSAFEDIKPGMKIIHVTVSMEYSTTYKTLNYKEVAVYDDDVYNDTDPVLLQAGADGTKQVTQRVVTKDGVQVSREVVDQVVITPATDEVTKYGNKIHYQTNYYGDTRIYRKKPTAGQDGWVKMTMDYITAYSSDGRTSTGSHTRFGTIAVNTYYIPYYTEIWVPGYGYGKALDTGAFRKYTNADGTPVNQLDLFFVRDSDANRWGRKRNVTVLVKMG